jgi:dipeptidase
MTRARTKIAVRVGLFLALAVLASTAISLGRFSAEGRDAECFTVLVGKNASADGSVMVAHNEDDRGDIIVNLRMIKARDYGGPQKVDLGRGGFYETDGRTNGFLWIEATTQEFADSFINDHGVLITSDSCPSRVTAEDYTDGGIGYMLRRLVAEKATSARDAIRIAGELVETYGYRAAGRTYSIADKNEAWMLALLRGRRWYAERVPDDEVAVIPNHYTIRLIHPDDPDYFMGSRDIVEFATKNGWYDETRDGPFDFKKAFERPSRRDSVFDGNTLRHWRGLNLLSGKAWEISLDYPFSVKPGKRVTAEALMAVLRDHYEGTEYDATDGYKTGTPNHTKFRTICTTSTINAFVVSLDPKRPEPISVAVWLALGKPDTTVFLPLYLGVENMPPGAGLGSNTHDYPLFYKQHFEDAEFKAAKGQLLHTKVLELEKTAEANYGPMHETLKKELFPAEKAFIESRPEFEADFTALYAKDKKTALKKLDEYVAAAFEKISDLTAKLLAKPPAS